MRSCLVKESEKSIFNFTLLTSSKFVNLACNSEIKKPFSANLFMVSSKSVSKTCPINIIIAFFLSLLIKSFVISIFLLFNSFLIFQINDI